MKLYIVTYVMKSVLGPYELKSYYRSKEEAEKQIAISKKVYVNRLVSAEITEENH